MFSVKLNNVTHSLKANTNLEVLLALQAYSDPHFAVSLNQCFVPRTQYATTFLKEGDVLETVKPMQGG